MDIPKAFRGRCQCGRWLFIPEGLEVFCECGLTHEFRGDTSATPITTGYSNPALSLCAIAEYTREQQEVLEIVRLHPRNTETIAWGVETLHKHIITENETVNILLELQSLGAVDVAFTLGDFTYWVLGRGGITPVGVDAASPPSSAGSERAAAQLNIGR